MSDSARRGVDVVSVLDVKRADRLRTESRQRHRVARVVSADDNHHVEGLTQQFDDGILTLLRCAADRVERPKIVPGVVVAVRARN